MTKTQSKPKVSKVRKSLEESRKKQKVETPKATFKSPEFVEDSDEEQPAEVEKTADAEIVQLEVARAPDITVEVEIKAGNGSAIEAVPAPEVEEASVIETEIEVALAPTPGVAEKYKNAKFVWNYKRIDSTPSTHTSFVGGSFVVPVEKRGAFYEKYFNEFVRWLNSPTSPPTLFLIERYNKEPFRFFVDIDYE